MEKKHFKEKKIESKYPCHAMVLRQCGATRGIKGTRYWGSCHGDLADLAVPKKYQKMPKMSSECPWNTMKWWWNNDVCRCFHTCSPCGLIFVRACEEHLGLNFACCADMKQEDWKDFLLASAGNGSARKDLEKLLQKPELVDSNFLDAKRFACFYFFALRSSSC